MSKPTLAIISPALADANNGNWHTARRWADFLSELYTVRIQREWDGIACDAMIALHARRSATSIARFAAACSHAPLVVVLTGTDLYRDIQTDASAQQSLQLATRLVVLQEAGALELPSALRHKTVVIYQSCDTVLPTMPSSLPQTPCFEAVMIGHLRDEKDPLTFMRTAHLVHSPALQLTQIGGALQEELETAARATQHSTPRYRWLGALPHDDTRAHLARSQLLVVPSKMEGGANVIAEAIRSKVPVVASAISGNRGMLGDNYGGFFPVGDADALAALLDRCVTDTAFYAQLQSQCAMRAPLFAPEHEQASLLQLMDNLRS